MHQDAQSTDRCSGNTGPHLPLAEKIASVKPRAFLGRPDTLRLSGLDPFEVTS